MQHLDDAKTAVLQIPGNRSAYLYTLFLNLPADEKDLHLFEKNGNMDRLSGDVSERQFFLALERQKPISAILSTGSYRSLRVESSTIVLNRRGSMILNYHGDAEVSDVVDYLQSCHDKLESCDVAG